MSATTVKNYRWIIVSLLFFGTTINYLDRQIIGLLKPILEKEFEWTETDFAHIVMAFSAAYPSDSRRLRETEQQPTVFRAHPNSDYYQSGTHFLSFRQLGASGGLPTMPSGAANTV